MNSGEGGGVLSKGRNKLVHEVGSVMSTLRVEGKLIDVVIMCGPRTIPAHRFMLAASSPFFEKLLVQDSKNNPSSNLDLEDVDAETMETLLDYIYKGYARPGNVDTEHMIHLMTTAHLLQIYSAGRYFCECLLHMRPCRNLALLWDWAQEFDCPEIEQTLIEYIVKNLDTVWKYCDFGKLSLDRLTTVLSEPWVSTNVQQEHVVQAVLAWIKYDTEKRKNDLALLSAFIAFQRLPEEVIHRLIQDEPILRTCAELKRYVGSQIHVRKQRRSSHLVPSTSESAPTVFLRDRRSTRTDHIITADKSPTSPSAALRCASGTSTQSDCPSYVTASRSLTNATPRLTRTQSMEKLYGELMLVAGRADGNKFVLQWYSFTCKAWGDREEIDVPSSSQEVLAHYRGNVYIIGGEDHRKAKLRDVVIYNLHTKKIRNGLPMRLARASAGIAQNGPLIYIVGGMSRFGKPMTHVECYNAHNNTWQILPAVKEKRTDPGLAVLNNRVYLIGGDTRRCEFYEPNSDSWHTASPLPEQLRQLAVAVAPEDGKLFTFRCYRPERVCCYDPDRNHWQWFRVNGQPPEVIRALASKKGEIWALDKSGKVWLFSTKSFSWDENICLPRNFTKPKHLCMVNSGDN